MVKFINKDIFREYDIRGIADIDLKDEVVYLIGSAFAKYLLDNNFKTFSISGDVRDTTPRIKKSFINGAINLGVDVYDMGTLPTPANYYSLYDTSNYVIPNSVQVTGSHNPSEYNGLKLSFNKKPFYGDLIQKLKKYIDEIFINDSSQFKNCKVKGKIYKWNILDNYYNYLYKNISIKNNINLVMDCGNAAGAIVAPNLYKSIGINVFELYCDVDPSFPNHHPDPTVDNNLEDIINIIKNGEYDLGIAFDGDADRIVAIDELGNIIRPDILLSLLLEDVINKNDTVVYDVKCSKSLEDTILKCKGKPLMWKTGHSLIKNKMIETKSKIGGEMSGHIFFADRYFGYDDGIYVGLRLIELLSKSKKKLSQLVNDIPMYISTPELRIDCNSDEEKDLVTSKLVDYFSKKYNCNTIDGVRINYSHGWALIRSSNTQPVIVFRFESDSLINLRKIKNEIFDKLNEFGKFDLSDI